MFWVTFLTNWGALSASGHGCDVSLAPSGFWKWSQGGRCEGMQIRWYWKFWAGIQGLLNGVNLWGKIKNSKFLREIRPWHYKCLVIVYTLPFCFWGYRESPVWDSLANQFLDGDQCFSSGNPFDATIPPSGLSWRFKGRTHRIPQVWTLLKTKGPNQTCRLWLVEVTVFFLVV